jgi:hypothetical protein
MLQNMIKAARNLSALFYHLNKLHLYLFEKWLLL